MNVHDISLTEAWLTHECSEPPEPSAIIGFAMLVVPLFALPVIFVGDAHRPLALALFLLLLAPLSAAFSRSQAAQRKFAIITRLRAMRTSRNVDRLKLDALVRAIGRIGTVHRRMSWGMGWLIPALCLLQAVALVATPVFQLPPPLVNGPLAMAFLMVCIATAVTYRRDAGRVTRLLAAVGQEILRD